MKHILCAVVLALTIAPLASGTPRMSNADVVIQATKPLKHPRGNRLPLIIWGVKNVSAPTDEALEATLRKLDERGIGVLSKWAPGRRFEQSRDAGLRTARIQKKIGTPVLVDATGTMNRFCDGSEATAHIAQDGTRFFDASFSERAKMGCPFALEHRRAPVRKQVTDFIDAYKADGLPLDVVVADWEVDGPIEWNGAWAHSKRCVVCRKHIPKIDDFAEFQRAIRLERAAIQREVYAKPILGTFPRALVGNYSVTPHNGLRYWYDYYEKMVEGAPHVTDQRAVYRRWFPEFGPCGYSLAMPVAYTWYETFGWYDFPNPDYRWFYNLLLCGTNALANAPADVPVLPIMHWNTTVPPKDPDPAVKQFSAEAYQELLWHLLLRGADGFIMWCRTPELADEARLLQEVYAASLEYRDFLDKGTPLTFDVPKQQGPVLSGLRLNNRVLIRRTDFDDWENAVTFMVGDEALQIPRTNGRCHIVTLGE